MLDKFLIFLDENIYDLLHFGIIGAFLAYLYIM